MSLYAVVTAAILTANSPYPSQLGAKEKAEEFCEILCSAGSLAAVRPAADGIFPELLNLTTKNRKLDAPHMLKRIKYTYYTNCLEYLMKHKNQKFISIILSIKSISCIPPQINRQK